MSADPTQEELVSRIEQERQELVTAVQHVRRDVNTDVAHLRAAAKHQLPKVAAVAALAVAAAVARRVIESRRAKHQPRVRLRVGRFTLLENV